MQAFKKTFEYMELRIKNKPIFSAGTVYNLWKMSDNWWDCHWSDQRFCRWANQHRIRPVFQNYWFALFNVRFQSYYRSSCSNYCYTNDFKNKGTKHKWYCIGIILMFTFAKIRWIKHFQCHYKPSYWSKTCFFLLSRLR